MNGTAVCLGMLAMLTAGCVIPPHLEEERGDFGINQRPMIRRDLTRPTQGGHTVMQSSPGTPARLTTFNIYLVDPDNEPLALRMFLKRNYREALADLTSTENTASVTLVPVDIQGLCDDKVNNLPGTYLLELFVSDRGFIDSNPDLLSPPAPELGGYMDSISWDIQCIDPISD